MNNDDKNAPSNYLLYLDAKNLYGHAMSEKMPIGKYTWDTDLENIQSLILILKILLYIILNQACYPGRPG